MFLAVNSVGVDYQVIRQGGCFLLR